MDKPLKMKPLPGQTLRKDLRKGVIPPLATFIRASFRMSVAGGLYLYGWHHAALIVAIMSAMMLIGAVEGHVAKTIAKAVPRAKTYLRQRKARKT